MAALSSTAEPLPVYDPDQVPQSAFDALLTRIVARLDTTDPDARVILESFVESQKAPAYDGPGNTEPPKPIDRYPLETTGYYSTNTLTRVKQGIVNEFYNAILTENNEAIALLIQHNLVTANTTRSNRTPLLEAITTRSISVVKELLDFGADPNAFGVARYGLANQPTLTPLMFAAMIGSLPLVKLLHEPPYSANDALVAPDGQIALRLAAAGGHRAIVDYLPSRRAGGFLRFKTQNAQNIERVKWALRNIGIFIKFFIWDVPKFFVWDIPKHGIVLPLTHFGKWWWENRKRFWPWCKYQLTEMPKRVARVGKAVWKGVKKVPKAIWRVAKKFPEAARKVGKELWKFGTETLPRWLKNVAIWLWKLVTERIPRATLIAVIWTWAGIRTLGQAIWDIILKIVSFIHTVLQAIVTFLRNVRLRDIWNAFCDVLRAIFVTIPVTLWSWLEKLGSASYKFMVALLGCFGVCLWWIIFGLKELVLYVPGRLWEILQSLGNSFAKAWYEIMVWISPKA